MGQITSALNAENWNKVKESAMSLKASAAYIGASNIHYDCYFIQFYHMKKDYESMALRYYRLVEDSIEFLLYTKKFFENNTVDEQHIRGKEITNFDYL